MKTTFKYKITVVILVLSALMFGSDGKDKVNSGTCLTVTGKVLTKKTNTKEKVMVYLIHGNNKIDSVKVNMNSTFAFRLRKNTEYSIKVMHQGYADRLIYISTWLPKKIHDNTMFEFHFDLVPFKPDESTKGDILDFPVALIYYHTTKGCFDYNKKYTTYIKKELNQPVFGE